MAKRKARQAQIPRRTWWVVASVVGIGLAALFLMASRPAQNNPSVAALSPQQYVADFAQTDQPHLLIDVRTPQEFADGHIPGAVNIPVDALASRLAEVPQGQPVVVYCRSGNRSATASQILAGAGYTSIYDMGAIFDWQAAGLPLQ